MLINKKMKIIKLMKICNGKQWKDYKCFRYTKIIENSRCVKIKNYEDYYIFVDGRVYSFKSNKFLKWEYSGRGYASISLRKNGVREERPCIHVLIYREFNKDYNLDDYDIHHKDENKTNNNLYNLKKQLSKHHTQNQDSVYNAKQNKDKIIKLYISGKTLKSLGNAFNVSNTVLRNIIPNNLLRGRLNKDYNKRFVIFQENLNTIKQEWLNTKITKKQIALKWNVSEGYVDKYIKK